MPPFAASLPRGRPSRPLRAGRLPAAAATVWAAWVVSMLAFLLFGWVAVRQHDTFHTRARDMGIYAQVIWNTGQGRPFASTLLEENRLHIAEHVAPVMALIVPAYALIPDPRLLLLLQQASLAAAGLPLFFWARKQVGDLPALGLLVGYEMMPATSRIAFSEFHPIVMAALPIALGVKATLEGRTRPAVVWLLLALLFEEETAPIVGAAGAYLWLRHRRWTGFGLGVLATLWLVLLVLIAMPSFHDRRTLAAVDGNRSIDHYEAIQERPAVVLEWLSGPRGAHAVTWLLLPTLGLPLLAPGILLIAAPSFVLLFLADREGNVVGHWAGGVLPVYWFAAAGGLATLRRVVSRQRAARRPPGGHGDLAATVEGEGFHVNQSVLVGRAFVGVLAVVLAFCFWEYSYFPGGGENDRDWLAWTEQEEDIARALALVPPGIEANATRRIVPHIANRELIYQFPSTLYSAPMRPDLRRIDLFLFDLTDTQTRRALDATDQDTVLTRSPRFAVRVWGETILLLTRDRPMPSQPADTVFGGMLRLYGHDLEQRPGRIRLTAYWESIARPAAWTRRAELLGADGSVVTEIQGAPLDPYLPPRRWDRGQLVAEAIDLRPPASAPDGTYRVRLGWQDQQGRPVLANGSEMVEVATVSLP